MQHILLFWLGLGCFLLLVLFFADREALFAKRPGEQAKGEGESPSQERHLVLFLMTLKRC